MLDQATGQTHELRADQVVLALGHSSRDTFAMLHERGVYVEAKPFSIGFRVEHPQGLIDRARWGRHAGHPALGAADYKLVHHASNGRSVYSFCMCPGGTVVAATSRSRPRRHQRHEPVFAQRAQRQCRHRRRHRPARLSRHARATRWRGIELQRQLESHAFVLGGGNYEAPGQLVGDFVAGRPSTALGERRCRRTSPAWRSATCRPPCPATRLKPCAKPFRPSARRSRALTCHDAVLTGVETRTSSPIKMTRGEDMQSLNVRGLYPAGEGASYAGGILSAGVDGIKVAEAVARSMLAEAEKRRLAAA